MSLAYTAGASRALAMAAQIAAWSEMSAVEPAHLLWGLLLDESRAATQLLEHGLTSERLQPLSPFDVQAHSQGAVATSTPPLGDVLEAVLFVARREAVAVDAAEIGTEHLLTALSRVESPVQDLLTRHGLTVESTSNQSARHVGFATAPLEMEEPVWLEPPPATDRADAFRLIDASANRLREGLRVLEDYVRFSLDDRHLSSLLKNWRHRFTDVIRIISSAALLEFRDTQGDVGTSLHTDQEGRRETLLEVAQAAFKRTQEAARTLEECGKVLDSQLGQRFGALRYELYTLEKAVLGTRLNRERLAGRGLYLLLTEALCLRGSGPALRAALAGGVGIVQIREKKIPDRELLEHARRVRAWTREAGALLIINDRPDLAALCDADGVHVGQEELTVRDARRIVGPGKLVGVSTHSPEQARQAVLDGADYIGVGPVFPSTTKSFQEFAGLDLVRQVTSEITLPAFAIGGITPDNVAEVVAAGAKRVAVSASICSAEQPQLAAEELCAALTVGHTG